MIDKARINEVTRTLKGKFPDGRITPDMVQALNIDPRDFLSYRQHFGSEMATAFLLGVYATALEEGDDPLEDFPTIEEQPSIPNSESDTPGGMMGLID